MARLGFADPAAASTNWLALGCSDDEQLLTSVASAADPDQALASFADLMAKAPDAATLQATVGAQPEVGRRLALVMGASTALADHLLRHPEDWAELADPDLDVVRPTAAGLAHELAKAQDRDDLRRIYRRLLLRLAARDLSMELRVEDAAAELADLAGGTIDAALAIAAEEVREPTDTFRLSVIGMGKCGARELNYVSDVDVIFVYEPVDGADELAAMRGATAVAAAMMRICSDHTREGTLWPVDAALRPEGKSGPLVRTLASHAAYYERWAKTWEFQALLKARPIAGDPDLGRRYMDTIAPLVWSAAERPGFVVDVRAMRRRVLDHIPSGEANRQIKLGPGGLRDIEFAVQLLQLVHGRSDTSLRSPNTLRALSALTAGGYVGRDDGAALADAYRFLRTLEHRLQLIRLRRTHTMPTDEESLRALGRSLGRLNDPVAALTRQWKAHAREVRRLHEKLFYRPLLEAVAALPGSEARLTTDAARERLEALGYVDPGAALRHLEALTSGVSRRAAIQRTLLPAMLGWFADAPNPDIGLLGFHQLSDALGSSHWYLRMLRDEGAAAERLATLLATSRYATDLMMRAPEVSGLLAHDGDLTLSDSDALVAECRRAALRQQDPVEASTAIRAVRRRELFRVATADVFGLVDVETVGRTLSGIARATLEGGLAAAQATIASERRGDLPTRIAVIAMGRLGGLEMSYASDADVLFVHDPLPGADEREAAEVAFAVVNEMRRLLAVPGPDPALDIDADLRPEGRQGPLVRTLASYAAYYERWSQVWEAQALLRATPVAGDPQVGADFAALVDPLRYPAKGMDAAAVAEVRRIKARIDAERLPRGADRSTHLKLGSGGLADVEWTVQLMQMRHGHDHPGLRTTQTMQALEAGVEDQLISRADAAELAAAWRSASRIRNAIMLVRGRPSDSLPTQAADRRGVAFLCGYAVDDAGRLSEEYRRVSRRAKGAVDRVFWA